MTEKRFFIGIDKKNGVGLFDGDLRLMYIQFSNIEDATSCENALIHQCNLMNELYEENRELQRHLDVMRSGALTDDKRIKELYDENEQLKQDNNALIHLLENQSMIIQELHSKLLEYQIQEPIVLTKEDLELMGKAISYYTHGRCGE